MLLKMSGNVKEWIWISKNSENEDMTAKIKKEKTGIGE